MAITWCAAIIPEHYEAFRRILDPHLPYTFKEWADSEADKVTQLEKVGHTVKLVQADPDEFARYLDATKSVHDLQSLDTFIREKSSGKHY